MALAADNAAPGLRYTWGDYAFTLNPNSRSEVLNYVGSDLRTLNNTLWVQPSAYQRQIELTATFWAPRTQRVAVLAPWQPGIVSLAYRGSDQTFWGTDGTTVYGWNPNGMLVGQWAPSGSWGPVAAVAVGPTNAIWTLSATASGTVIAEWPEWPPVSGTNSPLGVTTVPMDLRATTGLAVLSATQAFAVLSSANVVALDLGTASGTWQYVTNLITAARTDWHGLAIDEEGFWWIADNIASQWVGVDPATLTVVAREPLAVAPTVNAAAWNPQTQRLCVASGAQWEIVRLNRVDRDLYRWKQIVQSGQAALTDEMGRTHRVAVSSNTLQITEHLGFARGYDITVTVNETVASV